MESTKSSIDSSLHKGHARSIESLDNSGPVREFRYIKLASSKDKVMLKKIAVSQKVIGVCIFLFLVMLVSRFMVPPRIYTIMVYGSWVLNTVGYVHLILLSARLYNDRVAVLNAILFWVPILGIVALLVTNSRATKTLKASGLDVGVTGVALSEFKT
jgi:hypothetical protein